MRRYLPTKSFESGSKKYNTTQTSRGVVRWGKIFLFVVRVSDILRVKDGSSPARAWFDSTRVGAKTLIYCLVAQLVVALVC